MSPTVTNHLTPVMRQPSPSGSAVVGDPGRIRARMLLGDGDGVAPLAADAGLEPALPLVRGARAQRVRRAPDRVPQRVRELPELLLHDDLLEHREVGAAPLGGHVDRVEPGVEHRLADVGELLAREAAVVLAVVLERHQAPRQLGRAEPELLEPLGVGEVHALELPGFG